LAEHQGAQPGGDLVEVLGHGGVHRRLEAEGDHLAVQSAGARDRVDHEVHALVEAVGVEVDLEPVAGAHHDLAREDGGGTGGAAFALELGEDRREGVRVPGQGIEHIEIEVLVGGTESSEHVRQCRPGARALHPLAGRSRESCAQWGVMTPNPTSEPIFGDHASDRSRHLSASWNAAGPGSAAPAAAPSVPPLADPSALPAEHPARRPSAEGGVADASLLQELRGVRTATPSVWFMRQANRSLPEYRSLRLGTTMLDSCVRLEMAAWITVQPVRRHRVDAGIFLSDIVVPARQAGLGVEIQPGVGPVFDHPVRTEADVDALPPLGDDYEAALDPIREAVRLTVAELGTTPLIGFAGAPFTVASYMVEGGPSRDHLRTRALMRSQPEVWARLASWVAELSGRFLRAQVLAGASAVQLFDSWVGALSVEQYLAHVQQHSADALAHVTALPVPRIHFGVG